MRLLLSFLIALVLFSSDAFGRRGRGVFSNHYSSNNYSGQSAQPIRELTERVMPAKGRHLYEPLPRVLVHSEFNYRFAHENPAPDQARVSVLVSSDRLASLGEFPYVAVTYFELAHTSTVEEKVLDVELHSDGQLRFIVKDLKPESIYRMNLEFYRRDTEDQEFGESVFQMNSYYAVTSADSAASKVRHQVVTMGLIEANDWAVGRTSHRNARYNTGFSGGWCGMFQREFFERFTRVYDYTNGDEPSAGFRKHSGYVPASQLPAYAANGPIHGSYGALGAHKFMILGYSLDSGTLFTLDGNSNNSVRISEKTLGSLTSFGLISDDIAWEENLDVFPAASSKEN